MLNNNEFDLHPVFVWRSLDRKQRITLAVATIALLAFAISFYVMFGSAALSSL